MRVAERCECCMKAPKHEHEWVAQSPVRMRCKSCGEVHVFGPLNVYRKSKGMKQFQPIGELVKPGKRRGLHRVPNLTGEEA